MFQNNALNKSDKKPVVITSDSTCDLSPDLLERFDIKTIPLTIIMGNERYLDGLELAPDDIYDYYYKTGNLPQTASPGIQDLYDFFKTFTQAGFEVVHVDISSELSTISNVASIAAEELDGVYVIDSRSLSSGVGLLAIEAAECRDKGMSAAEIASHLNVLKYKVSASFVIDTLEFMWKGGRCSAITLLGANVMKIKPALKLIDGKIEVVKKYRGKMEHVYRHYIREELMKKKIRPGHIFITETGEISDDVLDELEKLVKSKTKGVEFHHTRAGCTVTSHCGPGTLGVLFIEE